MLSKAMVVDSYQKRLDELAKLPNIELTVVVPQYWPEGQRRISLQARPTAYRFIVENAVFTGHFHWHFYPRLGRVLREVRPDIFHVDEEPYNLCTAHALRLGRQLGTKNIFVHWQNIYRQYPPPFNVVEQLSYAWSDYAIAGNQEAKDILTRKGFTRPISVIPHAIDPDLYSARPAEPSEGPFHIGYAGRIIAAKGLTVLLQAATALKGDWRLSFLGEGELQGRLEREARELGVSDRVVFRPPVRASAVPDFIKELRVLVLPSLTTPDWKEQFGRVLIEAMACQVPVIGSDSGEIPNVIGDAGLVVSEGNAEHLRWALQKMMDEHDLRARLAARGRERALTNFSYAKLAQDTYQVYQELMCLRETGNM